MSEKTEFCRAPEGSIQGIDIFLPLDKVEELDEYKDENPYRNEETKQSIWDQFRISTVVSETVGRKVLDLGCGEGELSAALAQDHDVDGLDWSISAIRMAQREALNAGFIVGDAIDTPYADSQFDTVVLANLFEHVESPCALLREAHRLLRDDGRLILSTPSRYKTRNFRRIIRGAKVQLNSKFHVTEYTNGQVKEMLRWCGFSLIEVKTNLRCQTGFGTVLAVAMQSIARLMGSHVQFGDPTVYIAVALPKR